MNSILSVKDEIDEIITFLVSKGMCSFQNYPVIKGDKKEKSIGWGNITNLSIALKNIDYKDIYNEINKNHDYTMKLIDGTIIQLLYRFQDDKLYSHRLAVFPSPILQSFEEEPEIYLQDEIYGDILAKNIVPFPIRFDFCIDEVDSKYEHPKSHATLGQFKNCRIPVYGPLSPHRFMSFILENFYYTFYKQSCFSDLKKKCINFTTIIEDEKKKLHFHLES